MSRIALRMIARRAQERAHSLKTRFSFVDSSTPARKHSSALCRSPAKRRDSRYRLPMSSVKIRSKSAAEACASALPVSLKVALAILALRCLSDHSTEHRTVPLTVRILNLDTRLMQRIEWRRRISRCKICISDEVLASSVMLTRCQNAAESSMGLVTYSRLEILRILALPAAVLATGKRDLQKRRPIHHEEHIDFPSVFRISPHRI